MSVLSRKNAINTHLGEERMGDARTYVTDFAGHNQRYPRLGEISGTILAEIYGELREQKLITSLRDMYGMMGLAPWGTDQEIAQFGRNGTKIPAGFLDSHEGRKEIEKRVNALIQVHGRIPNIEDLGAEGLLFVYHRRPEILIETYRKLLPQSAFRRDDDFESRLEDARTPGLPATFGISSQAPFRWWVENRSRAFLEAFMRVAGSKALNEGHMPIGSEITIKLGLKDICPGLGLDYTSEDDVAKLQYMVTPWVEKLGVDVAKIEILVRGMDEQKAPMHAYDRLVNALADRVVELGARRTLVDKTLSIARVDRLAGAFNSAHR